MSYLYTINLLTYSSRKDLRYNIPYVSDTNSLRCLGTHGHDRVRTFRSFILSLSLIDKVTPG